MSTIKDALEARLAERYQAGFQAGYAKAVSELNEALGNYPSDAVHRQTLVLPQRQRPPRQGTKVAEKERRIREYLAEHSGTSYGDLKRALGDKVAVRIYSMRDRGEVAHSNGAFQLIIPSNGRE